jgi:hypothetical protein
MSPEVGLPCHMFLSQCDGIFSYNSFAGRCMCRDEDRIAHFEMVYCLFLERVQFERILKR